LKLSGVSLPLHFAVPFPAKCAHPACLSSRVHSIIGQHTNLDKVYDEVNDLKHTAKGLLIH
jgi:hypothetical protein